MKKKDKDRNIFIAICTIPTFLLFSLFVIYPTIRVFWISLYNWSGISNTPVFIGLQNYKALLNDKVLAMAFKNTLFLMLVVPASTMGIALFLATILTEGKIKGKNFYRIVLFFPNVLAIAVTSVLWAQIYHPTMGILNKGLEMIGLGRFTQTWLGDGKVVMWAIAITMIWQAVGYYMVLYIAGIDGIPIALYEAATVDGANGVERFWYITIPLLWEVIRVTSVFMISGVLFISFVFSTIMTGGGPNMKSEVLVTYMYNQAFSNANFGYAMAIAVVIFVFAILLALLSSILSARGSYDEN